MKGMASNTSRFDLCPFFVSSLRPTVPERRAHSLNRPTTRPSHWLTSRSCQSLHVLCLVCVPMLLIERGLIPMGSVGRKSYKDLFFVATPPILHPVLDPLPFSHNLPVPLPLRYLILLNTLSHSRSSCLLPCPLSLPPRPLAFGRTR